MRYLYTVLKYVFYLCNLVILLTGALLIMIGTYARINTSYISGDLILELLNPGNSLIVFGILLLGFGLLGAVGSLREVAEFLYIYIGAIGLLLLIELALVMSIFLGKEKVKELAHDGIIALIKNYRTLSDLTVIIDLVQTSLVCCGGNNNVNDWENNIYFNCSSAAISACGVPTSCCKQELRINTQCGYNAIENLFNKEVNILIGCLSGLFVLEIFVIAVALFLIVDRRKKRNLRIISGRSLADSTDRKRLQADWDI